MPISIDTVYQRVLAITNKEQRGYVTPLEFNLIANQAQLLIFEQYFYDLDKTKRNINDDSSFSDMVELIKKATKEYDNHLIDQVEDYYEWQFFQQQQPTLGLWRF